MTFKVVPMTARPGIQRDGTQFDSDRYVNGKWVRFQRGRPRKIGGYRGIFQNASGISRGMSMVSSNGLNYISSGWSGGVEQWQTDNDDGTGFGPTAWTMEGPIGTTLISAAGTLYTAGTYTNVPLTGGIGNSAFATIVVAAGSVSSVTITAPGYDYAVGDVLSATAASIGGTGSGFALTVVTVSSFTSSTLNLWQFDIGYDSTGSSTNNLVAHPGQNLINIDSTTNTPVLHGQFPGLAGQRFNKVGYFTAVATVSNASPTLTLAAVNSRVGAGQTVTGDHIPTGTTVLSVVGTTVTMSANGTGNVSNTTVTFDNNIAVSGGCVIIHPYLFVYGNNGLIQNSSAGDFDNWKAADANSNNVATGKIVKGLPVRGGTSSPSGLFWALDSLIRVSYSPTTNGSTTTYWTYDIISSQTSIMSSSCVVEYDGVYYWIGVDRFLMYNGTVQEIPNDTNQNHFFDHVNIAKRQKIWATKVPRWGEIWWFYPRNDATECNDAIIYNIREKTWYDAGEAIGARRSAGVFTEVFPKPVWAGNEVNTSGKYTLWQHETGSDVILNTTVDAIESFFETPALGAGIGMVGAIQQPGDNVWTHLERIEPDFVQTGNMSVIVTGKGYAEDADVESAPYSFDPTTLKIDMREQRREMRLRFISNTYNGDYETGKVMLSIDGGDVRSTGNQ